MAGPVPRLQVTNSQGLTNWVADACVFGVSKIAAAKRFERRFLEEKLERRLDVEFIRTADSSRNASNE